MVIFFFGFSEQSDYSLHIFGLTGQFVVMIELIFAKKWSLDIQLREFEVEPSLIDFYSIQDTDSFLGVTNQTFEIVIFVEYLLDVAAESFGEFEFLFVQFKGIQVDGACWLRTRMDSNKRIEVGVTFRYLVSQHLFPSFG